MLIPKDRKGCITILEFLSKNADAPVPRHAAVK